MEHCACGVVFKYIPVILGRSGFGGWGVLVLYCFCLLFFSFFKTQLDPFKSTMNELVFFFFFPLKVLSGVKARERI